MPPQVKYTEPKLPTVANSPSEVRPTLENYEAADQKNKFAIELAQRHNKNLQRTYNKKPAKKEQPKWTWPKFPNLFSTK